MSKYFIDVSAKFEPWYEIWLESDESKFEEAKTGNNIEKLIDWAAKQCSKHRIPLNTLYCFVEMNRGKISLKLHNQKVLGETFGYKRIMSEVNTRRAIKKSKFYVEMSKNEHAQYRIKKLKEEQAYYVKMLYQTYKQIDKHSKVLQTNGKSRLAH